MIGCQSIQVSALGQRVIRAKTDLVVAGVDVVAAALRVVVADAEFDGSVQLVVNERLRRVEPGAVIRAWGSRVVAVVNVAIGSAQRNRTDCIGAGGADDLQRGRRNECTVDGRRVETGRSKAIVCRGRAIVVGAKITGSQIERAMVIGRRNCVGLSAASFAGFPAEGVHRRHLQAGISRAGVFERVVDAGTVVVVIHVTRGCKGRAVRIVLCQRLDQVDQRVVLTAQGDGAVALVSKTHHCGTTEHTAALTGSAIVHVKARLQIEYG